MIYFHEYSKSKFAEVAPDQFAACETGQPIIVTGEQGYRSAIVSHGISGKDHSSFYFEMEVLPPKTPLPFVNIKPAVRVGICNLDIQNVDKPLGSNLVSYSYASTGKLVHNAQSKVSNCAYQVGDTVSVLVSRFPNKPDFLRSSSASKVQDSKTKDSKLLTRKTAEFVQSSSDPVLPDLTEQDL